MVQRLVVNHAANWGIKQSVRLCFIAHLLLDHSSSRAEANEFRQVWRPIFTGFTELLHQAARKASTPFVDDDNIINGCLSYATFRDIAGLIGTTPAGEEDIAYEKWFQGFKPDESATPDEYFLALMQIHKGDESCWRVRRLKDLDRAREAGGRGCMRV